MLHVPAHHVFCFCFVLFRFIYVSDIYIYIYIINGFGSISTFAFYFAVNSTLFICFRSKNLKKKIEERILYEVGELIDVSLSSPSYFSSSSSSGFHLQLTLSILENFFLFFIVFFLLF